MLYSQIRAESEAADDRNPLITSKRAEGTEIVQGYAHAVDCMVMYRASVSRCCDEIRAGKLRVNFATLGVFWHHYRESQKAVAIWKRRVDASAEPIRIAAWDAELSALESSTTDPHLRAARDKRYARLVGPFADLTVTGAGQVRPVPSHAA